MEEGGEGHHRKAIEEADADGADDADGFDDVECSATGG